MIGVLESKPGGFNFQGSSQVKSLEIRGELNRAMLRRLFAKPAAAGPSHEVAGSICKTAHTQTPWRIPKVDP